MKTLSGSDGVATTTARARSRPACASTSSSSAEPIRYGTSARLSSSSRAGSQSITMSGQSFFRISSATTRPKRPYPQTMT
jgi:hypothetical protein